MEATCDRIMIINQGKIVANGTADTLRKSAQGGQILKVKILGTDSQQILDSLNQTLHQNFQW